jgi:hypothetical protein
VVRRTRAIYNKNIKLLEQDLVFHSLAMAMAVAAEMQNQIRDLLPSWHQEVTARNRALDAGKRTCKMAE